MTLTNFSLKLPQLWSDPYQLLWSSHSSAVREARKGRRLFSWWGFAPACPRRCPRFYRSGCSCWGSSLYQGRAWRCPVACWRRPCHLQGSECSVRLVIAVFGERPMIQTEHAVVLVLERSRKPSVSCSSISQWPQLPFLFPQRERERDGGGGGGNRGAERREKERTR